MYSVFFYYTSQEQSALKIGERDIQILIHGDDYQLDDEVLRFKGKELTSNEVVHGSYLIKSKKEAAVIGMATKSLILSGFGSIEKIPSARNLGAFDYRNYLKQQGIFRQIKLQNIKKVAVIRNNTPVGLLKELRGGLKQHIDQQFPEELASYVKSLFLGIRDSLFKEKQREYSQLGISHFFSISGIHIYFFLGMFHFLLKRLRVVEENLIFWEGLFFFSFAILTGFSTSIARSVFYLGGVRLNQHFKWRLTLLDCWSICLLVNLFIQPYVLFTVAGQLSFGLTWVIIFVTPILKNMTTNLVWRTALFGFLISLFSVPIIAYHFYEWQLAGLVLSVLFAPIFSYLLMPVLFFYLFLSLTVGYLPFIESVEKILIWCQNSLFHLNNYSFLHIITGKVPLLIYLFCLSLIVVWLISYQKNLLFKYGMLILIIAIPSTLKYLNPIGYVAFVDVG